jgi:hypothetical protein
VEDDPRLHPPSTEHPMKYKFAVAVAAAVFAASFTLGTARAQAASQCNAACFKQYRLCMEYTPHMAPQCFEIRRQCLNDCDYSN